MDHLGSSWIILDHLGSLGDFQLKLNAHDTSEIPKDSMEPNAHKTNCRDSENRVPMKVLFETLGAGASERWKTRTWPRCNHMAVGDTTWKLTVVYMLFLLQLGLVQFQSRS